MRKGLGLAILALAVSAVARTAPAQEKVVFLGVDFTHAVFYDEHFIPDHLIQEEIPAWNEGAAFYLGRKVCAKGVTFDLEASRAQNGHIEVSAVKQIAPKRKEAPELTAALVRSEIAPYVNPSASGLALVLVIDQVNKDSREVTGHVISFDRKSGDPRKFERYSEGAHGGGVRNYYMNPIKELAGKACKFIP